MIKPFNKSGKKEKVVIEKCENYDKLNGGSKMDKTAIRMIERKSQNDKEYDKERRKIRKGKIEWKKNISPEKK